MMEARGWSDGENAHKLGNAGSPQKLEKARKQFFKASGRNPSCGHLDCSPVKLSADFWSPEMQGIKFVLF